MKITKNIAFVLTGWIVGSIAILLIGLIWPSIFPAVLENGHYYGEGPSLSTIILMAMAFASPFALVGGFIGSRIPREGGQAEQYLMAGIMGVFFAVPFACAGLWLFTGW